MFCFLTYDTYTYTKSDIQLLYQEAIYKMKNAIKKRTIFLRHMLNVFLTSVCIFIQCFYVLQTLKYYIIIYLIVYCLYCPQTYLTSRGLMGTTFYSSNPHFHSSSQTCKQCFEQRVKYSDMTPNSAFSLQKVPTLFPFKL